MKPLKNSKHLARVHDLPCCNCGAHPVEAHHIRAAGLTGTGQKASDWLTIPLCPECHRWIHRDRKLWEMACGPQIRHVENTLNQLYGATK